jgi:hypothetical protein
MCTQLIFTYIHIYIYIDVCKQPDEFDILSMSYVVDKLVMSTWQAEILTIQSSHVEPGRNVVASG